jgi:large subunit ribosomal protein L19e
MNLNTKRRLAARALGVGVNRIRFNNERLSDVQEAITKQDIRDLVADGALSVREVRGRSASKGERVRRRAGSVKHHVKPGKTTYVMFVRKMRAYLAEMRKQKTITSAQFTQLRKELKGRHINSKTHLKERITHLKTTQ